MGRAPRYQWATANLWRTVAFVLALGLFFAVARGGVAQTPLLSAFAIYLVTATLWVRGLDEESITGAGGTLGRAGWLIAVSPLAAAVVAYLVFASARNTATFVFGAIISAYLAAGLAARSLREQIRQGTRSRALEGPILVSALAVAVGSTALALLLLGRGPDWLVLLALPALAVPLLVQLLSEHRIVAEEARPSARARWSGLGLGALALLLGAAGSAFFSASHSLGVLVVVVMAMALAAALATGTLVDIALVLAVIGLLGVTPATTATPSVMRGGGSRILVALGDSYLSGEGASAFIERTDEGGGNQCHRAATAWPVLVTHRDGAFDRLVFRACSGAQSFNLRSASSGAPAPVPREQYAGEGTQIARAEEELGPARPALVVISVGGNDAGFTDVGITCLALGSCNAAVPSRLWVGANLDRVRNRLRQTYQEVEAAFGDVPVAVIPYPDPIYGSSSCRGAPLSNGDVAFLTTFLDRLDTVLAEEARARGFYYVGQIRTALSAAGIQLCNPAGNPPGLNFLNLRSVRGGAAQRFNPVNWKHNSLHPNERGHAAMAAAFEAWLAGADRDPDGSLQSPVQRRTADGTTPVAAVPEQSLPGTAQGQDCGRYRTDDPEHGCAALSLDWALRQTGTGLLGLAVPAGTGGVGAWLVTTGIVARRRRRRRGTVVPGGG